MVTGNNFYIQREPVSVFYNNFIRLSRKYNIYTPLISKNACTTLLKAALIDCGYKDIIDNEVHKYRVLVPSKVKGTVVAVIREPIKRLISAYNTISSIYGKPKSIDLYLYNVIKSLNNINADRHILSQFKQYDLSKVDMFIPIEYLDIYLKELGICINRVNVSAPLEQLPNKDIINNLRNILEKDYSIYESILKSEKCYKPTDKMV